MQAKFVTMDSHVVPVELEKAYRLLNHGPTVLVSASAGGISNVMAASWACALDFSPPKVTVVLDKITRTRGLVEDSGCFVLQIPTAAQLKLTHALGTTSRHEDDQKLARSGVELFQVDGVAAPLVAGCAAWLICRVMPEPHNQQTYDLFIGEVIAAWADTRVFSKGHWQFETADPQWRTIHYIAGGQFYAIGESINALSQAPVP